MMSEEKKMQPDAATAVGGESARSVGDAPTLPRRWYVVHTYSGHENKVRENIQKMINASSVRDHFGQIVVPTEEVAEM
jgi:transcriptional antiterminator NusG